MALGIPAHEKRTVAIKILYLVLWLLLSGCATAHPLVLLGDLPAFDQATADRAYEPIRGLEVGLGQLGNAISFLNMAGIAFTDSNKKYISDKIEIVIYHKAMATLAVYHAQPLLIDEHVVKAQAGLDAILARLEQIIAEQKSI